MDSDALSVLLMAPSVVAGFPIVPSMLMRIARTIPVSDALFGVFLLSTFLAIYVPDVGRGFVKDDFEWVTHSSISTLEDLGRVLTTAPSGFYRPVVSMSFAVNRGICGVASKCYGLTNMAIALTCAISLCALGTLLSLPSRSAITAAAIWLFNWHGVNIATMWISGRTSLVATLFAILTAIAFVWQRAVLASVLLAVALFSKEETVLFPLALLVWGLVRARNGQYPWKRLAAFGIGSLIAEAVYFVARIRSGAFTLSTAPSSYQLSFTPSTLLNNGVQYLDRTTTFALVVVIVLACVLRARRPRFDSNLWDVVLLGSLCWIAALGVTVWLPVRSSLYALLPATGIALSAGALITALAKNASERTAAILVPVAIVPILLSPVYHLRNGPLRAQAELSTSVLASVRTAAQQTSPPARVIVYDRRTQKPTVSDCFGGFLQQATDLVVHLPLSVVLVRESDALNADVHDGDTRLVVADDGITGIPPATLPTMPR